MSIRPLRRRAAGHYVSADGKYTFMRHHSDPHPQRWFTYYEDDRDPLFFDAPTTLRRAVVKAQDHEL